MSNTDSIDVTPETQSSPHKSVWMRGLMMVLIAVLIGAAQSLLLLMTVVQFVLMLVDKGTPNPQIAKFGETVGTWLAKAALFQTAKSENKPWPFAPLD